MMTQQERAFSVLRQLEPPQKPRRTGFTDIRGPWSPALGRHGLADLLEATGPWVDSLTFPGGSCALLPRTTLASLIELCHRHEVLAAAGGVLEYTLPLGAEAFDRTLGECRELGFDIVELASGAAALGADDWPRLVEKVQRAGLRARPVVEIRLGTAGATATETLEGEGTIDVDWTIQRTRRLLQAGAWMVLIGAEGMTEGVQHWNDAAPSRIADAAGREQILFAASGPAAFSWYAKNCGRDVNLSVPADQMVRLAELRAGLWGSGGSVAART